MVAQLAPKPIQLQFFLFRVIQDPVDPVGVDVMVHLLVIHLSVLGRQAKVVMGVRGTVSIHLSEAVAEAPAQLAQTQLHQQLVMAAQVDQ